ncbi:MAG: hypothetical protein ABSF48_26160, partial [Thermodesulfobacteriota bacterium]
MHRIPLPSIQGITYTPIFSSTATLETAPGYHESTGLYFIQTTTKSFPPVSDIPTEHEIKEATHILFNEVLIDFPFKDNSSK